MSDIVKDDTQTPPSLKHQIEDVLRDTQTLNGLRIEGLNYKVTAFTRAPLLLEQALAEIKVLEQRHADALDALNRMTDQRDEALGGQPAIELPDHIVGASEMVVPEQRITKPARIGGVVFQPGIKVASVIEAAYRAAEYHQPNPVAFQALQDMLVAAPKPEGGAA